MNFNLRDRNTLTPVVRYGEQLSLKDFCTYHPDKSLFHQVIVPPPVKGISYKKNNQMKLSDDFWLKHPPHLYLKIN